MTPVLQVLLGFSIGLIGALLLAPHAINYMNNQSRRRSVNCDTNREYYCEPGQNCAICLDQMDASNMRYLKCGHALHDVCFDQCKRRNNKCPTCRADM